MEGDPHPCTRQKRLHRGGGALGGPLLKTVHCILVFNEPSTVTVSHIGGRPPLLYTYRYTVNPCSLIMHRSDHCQKENWLCRLQSTRFYKAYLTGRDARKDMRAFIHHYKHKQTPNLGTPHTTYALRNSRRITRRLQCSHDPGIACPGYV